MPSTWQLILHASLVVKLILVILAGFSVFSWALILQKYLMLRAATRQSAAFLRAFEAGGTRASLAELARSLPASPAAQVFQAALEPSGTLAGDRIVQRAAAAAVEGLHAYLTFLATTGATTPFIGLLGTVWGIMDAFRGIGAAGSASLAVLAPAIAEALVTTAAGLLAAIPAVIAYNAFLHWIRHLAAQTEAFTEQLQEGLPESAAHEKRSAARPRL